MDLRSSAKDLFGSEPSKFSVPFCNTKERNKLTWNTTRDFSNKYVLMLAPMIWNDVLKSISIYFPNLDELSFRVVFAFPMASMIGDEARTRFSIWVSVWEVPPTVAKYLMAYLALTVLPAPDSPDTMMDWSRLSLKKVKLLWESEYSGDSKTGRVQILNGFKYVGCQMPFENRAYLHCMAEECL